MRFWKNGHEFLVLAHRQLFVALVGDVMDKMGSIHRLFPAIQPLPGGVASLIVR